MWLTGLLPQLRRRHTSCETKNGKNYSLRGCRSVVARFSISYTVLVKFDNLSENSTQKRCLKTGQMRHQYDGMWSWHRCSFNVFSHWLSTDCERGREPFNSGRALSRETGRRQRVTMLEAADALTGQLNAWVPLGLIKSPVNATGKGSAQSPIWPFFLLGPH